MVDRATAASLQHEGWCDESVALAQEKAYTPLLDEMRSGRPRADFVAAANAVKATGLREGTLLEVGCGSGYYAEVFDAMLDSSINYTGLDASPAMIDLARQNRPHKSFFVANAVQMPFNPASFDIVFNGVSLLHIVEYETAVREAHRVARQWCIFHTVPLVERRPTTFLTKDAYGGPTIEVIFNQTELFLVSFLRLMLSSQTSRSIRRMQAVI